MKKITFIIFIQALALFSLSARAADFPAACESMLALMEEGKALDPSISIDVKKLEEDMRELWAALAGYADKQQEMIALCERSRAKIEQSIQSQKTGKK